MAFPFLDKVFTFKQPDGTEIQLRGSGNQYYAVFETLEGYTVLKNPRTGFYEIAQLAEDGSMLEPAPGPQGNTDASVVSVQPRLRISPDAARANGMEGAMRMGGRRCDLRREQRRQHAAAMRRSFGPLMAPPQRETTGDFRGLCLIIDFPDDPGTISREEVDKFCNEPGYTGFGNNGSVFDYFKANSISRCRYTNMVVDYYTAQHAKSHYTDPSLEQGIRARQLIIEALAHLQANNFNFSSLTADSDGFLYAMNVYYAGEVENAWAEGLWPHAWHLATPVQLAPGISAFDYQFTDMSHELTLGTFCHENGHMLCDYPDLYDYGGESSGTGAYCLMCAGGNISQKNPTHISAYLKRLSGWAKSVAPVQHNQQIDLRAGENEFAIYSKSATEYFIIENRAKAGRDIALPDAGLAIWHVDEEGNNSNQQMTVAQHYELSLEQADGSFHLESRRGQLGDSTDLYDETVNRFSDSTVPASKWWDGTASNLDVFAISAPGETMSFSARLFEDTGSAQTIGAESTPALAIPDNRADGVSDIIAIGQDAIIADVKVELDISHTYIGDLQVTLLTPWSDAIVLHQRHQGRDADDIKRSIDETELQTLSTLHGRNTRGEWRLHIQDFAPVDTGTLNRWALEFSAAEQPQGPVVLEESPGTQIPDDVQAGIKRSITTNASGNVSSVEVSIDITHTYIADLQISLHSPLGTEVVLHKEGTGGSDDDVVKTYTTTTTPALASLSSQSISGEWQLRVSDRVGQDVGKLNNWRLVIHS